MSEYEILDVVVGLSAEQTAVLVQLVNLHMAMVVGIYYFLHRSGLAMKCAIALLYTLGFAMHLGMLLNQSELIVGARRDLIAITESGERLSNVGFTFLSQTGGVFDSWVSLVANASIIALWFGTLAFLFFWKRPKDS